MPWQDIAGLRDLITHAYFHIEMNRVLEIVERDLPVLDQAINRLLAEPDPDERESEAEEETS